MASRRLKISGLLVCLTLGVGFLAYENSPLAAQRRKEAFINDWSRRLSAAHTLDRIKPLGIYTRTFPNSEWVAAICQHSCCSGSGYDATVIYDSLGVTRIDRSYTFCGMVTLSTDMDKVPAQSTHELYRGLEERLGLRFEVRPARNV